MVDGDETSGRSLTQFFVKRGWLVECVDRAREAVKRLEAAPFSLVIADVMLPDVSALDAMQVLAPDARLIAVSTSAYARTILRAAQLRAVDCLIKPVRDEDLEEVLQSLTGLEHPIPILSNSISNEKIRSNGSSVRESSCFHWSSDLKLARLAEIAARVADSDVPVLISGESGVGKGVLANYIHRSSSRRDHPFVKVNCAALPLDLLESELFGYERGAFTGAMEKKPGKFELANGGSILLDEIGDMPLPLQAKLLHVLQDQEFSRLGATQTIRVTSRTLATTNSRMETAVSRGEFREDLFYRLNVIRLEVPPLREHIQDVLALCRYFMDKYMGRYCGNERVELPTRLLGAFCSYRWPGNVRQLENIIKQFLILRDEGLVLQSLLQTTMGAEEELPFASPTPLAEEVQSTKLPEVRPRKSVIQSLKNVGAEAAERAEKEIVFETLNKRHWNRKMAARELGISYKTLLTKLQRWDGKEAI
ncbi:MAG: sigma-54 dependent transcriptional regulator [Acidobacteriota bacterium]